MAILRETWDKEVELTSVNSNSVRYKHVNTANSLSLEMVR